MLFICKYLEIGSKQFFPQSFSVFFFFKVSNLSFDHVHCPSYPRPPLFFSCKFYFVLRNPIKIEMQFCTRTFYTGQFPSNQRQNISKLVNEFVDIFCLQIESTNAVEERRAYPQSEPRSTNVINLCIHYLYIYQPELFSQLIYKPLSMFNTLSR